MNVEPTVEIIQKMAKELDYRTGRIGQNKPFGAFLVNEG